MTRPIDDIVTELRTALAERGWTLREIDAHRDSPHGLMQARETHATDDDGSPWVYTTAARWNESLDQGLEYVDEHASKTLGEAIDACDAEEKRLSAADAGPQNIDANGAPVEVAP